MGKSKGYRVETRSLLKKPPRERGVQALGSLLQAYNPGDRVVLIIDSSTHKGMPHRRFHGKVGVITEKRGRSYCVAVQEGGKIKTVISRPEHLRPYH